MFLYNLPIIPVKKPFKIYYKPSPLENEYDDSLIETKEDNIDISKSINDPFSLFIFFCCFSIWLGNYTRIKLDSLFLK
tara:strand:+ start:22184 stop:22417 length:234 start_codon:yes stop_codon:yes gene_type:complete